MYVPTVYDISKPTSSKSLEDVEDNVFSFIYSDRVVEYLQKKRHSKYVFYNTDQELEGEEGVKRVRHKEKLSKYHIHVDLNGQDCVKVSQHLHEARVEFNIYKMLRRTNGEDHFLARMIRSTSPVIDGKQYIFMRRYMGTLHMVTQMDRDRAETVRKQLSDATDHLLGLGVVHRDIKGENVLVERLSPIKIRLSDFGLCFTRESFTSEHAIDLDRAIRRMYRGGTRKYKVPDAGVDVVWEPTGDPFYWVAQHRNYHEIMVTLMVARTNDQSRFPIGLKPEMSHYEYLKALEHTDGIEEWCEVAFEKMSEALLNLNVKKKRVPKRDLDDSYSLHEEDILELLASSKEDERRSIGGVSPGGVG